MLLLCRTYSGVSKALFFFLFCLVFDRSLLPVTCMYNTSREKRSGQYLRGGVLCCVVFAEACSCVVFVVVIWYANNLDLCIFPRLMISSSC